jgi:adenine deaminase
MTRPGQMDPNFSISGNIVDVVRREVFPGTLQVENGRIRKVIREVIREGEVPPSGPEPLFILPGFIDAHVHIESSMLTPSEFARLAVVHGTTGTVSDPHEIANVLGMEGVRFMIENGKRVPFRFNFGAPSCVPATPFESSGAVITPDDIRELLKQPEIKYLSEMMNFPGVIHGDGDVQLKLQHARKAGKVIDGHIPGIAGPDLQRYVSSGISTDHECFTIEEALEKIALGMKILIREGSAAKNFDELVPLLASHPQMVMFCSDDKHPDDLIEGHMDQLIRRAIGMGHELFDVLRAATLNPVEHYGLEAGLLQEGDAADMVVVNNLQDLQVLQTWIGGKKVAENGQSLLPAIKGMSPNRFSCQPVELHQLKVVAGTGDPAGPTRKIRVIQAFDGQLVTRELCMDLPVEDGYVNADPGRDLLKLVSLNRYRESEPALAFIRGFGLKRGAIASTVAHDSHNIIAVGCADSDIARAINLLVENKGGIALAYGSHQQVLPLPVAGIMTQADGYETARLYKAIDGQAKKLGSPLTSPFMTLSFMALLVIPELKLSDKGLFDGKAFGFTPLFCD